MAVSSVAGLGLQRPLILKNVIQVAKEGGYYDSIQSAIDEIKTRADSSWSNPYLIRVGPGVYNEDIVLDVDGVMIWGSGYGKTRIYNVAAGDTFTIQPQSPTVYPWDIHLYDIAIYNNQPTNAALKVDGTLGGAGTSFLGNELGLFNCVLQNTAGGYSLDAFLANYISGTWANWIGTAKMVNVAGFWGWYVVPISGVDVSWDTALNLPNDTGNYGFALKTSDSIGAVITRKEGIFIGQNIYDIASITLQDTSKVILRETKPPSSITTYSADAIEWDAMLMRLPASVGLPTASATYDGKEVVIVGGTGVRNRKYICLKSDSDTYAWVEIVNGGV